MRCVTACALVALTIVALPARGQPVESRPTGTYHIAVCKAAPCSPSDVSNALVWGVLVLADSTLALASIPDSARHLLRSSVLGGPANGCHATRRRRTSVETFAGLMGAGTTHWARDTSGTLTFTLYTSADARYVVRAKLQGDTLRGTGESSGVGVAEVHYAPDTLVAVRVGRPDITPCIEASVREWRRIRALYTRP